MQEREDSLVGVRRRLEAGALSARALMERVLAQIDAHRELNAFVHVEPPDVLLDRADQVDRRRRDGGQVGDLAGIPIAVKDNLCVEGAPMTAGSRILRGFVAPYDATVARALIDRGAIIVGKTNLDEFAMGSSSETSTFGPVRNPHDRQRVAGGSSGGSAAAVAAGMCLAALGSDTGGSVRQPASHCGVVGLKPTYGRVSRYGLVAHASSLDQVGPITRDVADAAVMLEAIAGHDPRDATSARAALPDLQAALHGGVDGVTLGLPREYLDAPGLCSRVAGAIGEAVASLAAQGADVVEVSLPHTEYVVPVYYLIATAEASSNLARYDGVRFGHRADDVASLREVYERTRAEGFGGEVKRRVMLGTHVLSAGFHDEYYARAQKARTLIARDFEQAFEVADILVAPSAPSTAFKLGARAEDPLSLYLDDVFTVGASLAGLPAMSVPLGGARPGDLPMGLQLIAPAWREDLLLRVGVAWEALRR